jgi:hypothetical protein
LLLVAAEALMLKYGIAALLGVPVSVLVIIYALNHC